MFTPRHGQAFGCSDSSPPEVATEEQLSRILDASIACRRVSEEAKAAFWATVPVKVVFEFNWSKWSYEPA